MNNLRILKALLTWPRFSLTSYRMISGLARQGLRPAGVIDVGANAGQFAVAAIKVWGVPVHSFEPNPGCVEKLSALSRKLPGVSVHPVALGAAPGHAEFHVNRHSHSSSLLRLGAAHKTAFPHAQEGVSIQVPVSTLDKELDAVDLKSPILLKLDVQGYESQVLAGAKETLRRARWVLLETSFKPLYEGEPVFRDILSQMESSGFAFARPAGWLEHPKTGEILQMDALFEKQ